ncbi:hypothetical protein [Candidatus Korobacter versatilis]|uniref:hypothetical protein n=1 Tax=Candidatus Korobacter versatilis TaxID=658062 RepID=UPI0005A47670|nr:hypothetical protein [Candidatus Koribacter versatilis]
MKRRGRSTGATKKKSGARPKAAPRKRRSSGRGKFFAIAAVVLLLAFLGYRFVIGTGINRKPTPVVAQESRSEAEPESNPVSLDRIVGQWTRSDTPARIEIRSVRDDGRLDASYYNPHSIHIETAAAKKERDYVRVYLKLQDPSEPGSTYRLNYDPALDVMRGDYYDGVARQKNEVAFARSK